jgi:hypothetical protein
MIPTPVLCRLCRRPIPRAAVKCPYCRARLSWGDPARDGVSGRPRRGWQIAAYAMLLALLAVAAVVGLSVLRDVEAPISSVEGGSKPAGRPSTAECARLLSELANAPAPDQRVAPDVRDRLRQCFDRR